MLAIILQVNLAVVDQRVRVRDVYSYRTTWSEWERSWCHGSASLSSSTKSTGVGSAAAGAEASCVEASLVEAVEVVEQAQSDLVTSDLVRCDDMALGGQ